MHADEKYKQNIVHKINENHKFIHNINTLEDDKINDESLKTVPYKMYRLYTLNNISK